MERIVGAGQRMWVSGVYPLLQPRIVVAAEDGPLRPLVATALRSCAGRLTFVSTLAEALAACRDPFDALIVDLDLPVRDGLGLIFHLEKEAPEALGRIIGISSSVDSYAALVSENLVHSFLSKPFSLSEMTRRVQMCVTTMRSAANA